jgi:hypothetical protein
MTYREPGKRSPGCGKAAPIKDALVIAVVNGFTRLRGFKFQTNFFRGMVCILTPLRSYRRVGGPLRRTRRSYGYWLGPRASYALIFNLNFLKVTRRIA